MVEAPPPVVDEEEERARRRGGRIALISYFGLVAVVCALGGGQVILQGLRAQPDRGPTFASCADALSRLSGAIDRAREKAGAAGGEDAAVDTFRGALAPEWDGLDGARRLCGDAGREDLSVLERLRYAEEHAIRREAAELAPLRRRARER